MRFLLSAALTACLFSVAPAQAAYLITAEGTFNFASQTNGGAEDAPIDFSIQLSFDDVPGGGQLFLSTGNVDYFALGTHVVSDVAGKATLAAYSNGSLSIFTDTLARPDGYQMFVLVLEPNLQPSSNFEAYLGVDNRYSTFRNGILTSFFIDPALLVFPDAPGIPEPTTWAMMIGGFAAAGAAMRRRSQTIQIRYGT